MANDVREIYEAVIGEVRKELSEMVPQYEERIIQSLNERCEDFVSNRVNVYDGKLEKMKGEIHALEGRLTKIEQMIKMENSMESRIKGSSTARKTCISVQKEKVDMSRGCIEYRGYKFDGWVYYPNDEMGDFLYKVRIDGTENQQLTDYSLRYSCGFNVKNGKLFFEDKDFKVHSISIS